MVNLATLAAEIAADISSQLSAQKGRRKVRVLRGPSMCEVWQILARALARGWGCLSAHGGSVPNCYRYPAYTDVYAVGAARYDGALCISYGVNLLSANKVTLAGARGSCISGRRAGPWWSLPKKVSPLDLVFDMAEGEAIRVSEISYGTLACLVGGYHD